MRQTFRRSEDFARHEPMLVVCAVVALISMLFMPPDAEYLSYIDFRVLCLLFSLMAVVLGFQECGFFRALAHKLLSGEKQLRLLSLILVLLPFFASMVVTNDVSLITFVPFTILVLSMVDQKELLIRIVVLQTMAANLGSMATPVGSPHDLYLYEYYKLSAGEFFKLMLPLTGVSLAGLSVAALCTKTEPLKVRFEEEVRLHKPKKFTLYTALFILCLLSVFRVLPYLAVTAFVFIAMLLVSPKLLRNVDYSLLLTFVCFFIFAGNMGRIPDVRGFLSGLLEKNTLLTAILSCQLISNVPASVLLSGFTQDWRALLLGTNIGGLGTPIASLASLISLRLYLRSEGAKPVRYLAVFTLANAGGIFLLLAAVRLFHIGG